MRIPLYSDPDVLEQLYRRFPYLAGQPLDLRGVSEGVTALGTLQTESTFAFVGADLTEPLPYSPDFPFLRPDEQEALTHYLQLGVLEPWPRPLLDIAWTNGEDTGVLTQIRSVDVVFTPVGHAQIWWGGDLGVVWEAVLELRLEKRPDEAGLLGAFWDCCEHLLSAAGVKQVWTYNRDPSYGADDYAAFLQNRGYSLDPERADLDGGLVAAVKTLK